MWRRSSLALVIFAACGGCSLLVENNLAGKPEEGTTSEGATVGAGSGGSTSSASASAGSGTTSSSSSGAGGVMGCDGLCEPSSCCSGACVDLMTSAAHCGACGNDCLAGRTCASGKCEPAWLSTASAGEPEPRTSAAAAWIGKGMFVWGGQGATSDLQSGGVYDPALNAWTQVTEIGAPTPRAMAVAVWTGAKVIVFGGGPSSGKTGLADGGIYDPVANAWSPDPMVQPMPPVGRRRPVAVWTGTQMLVWGGEANDAPVGGGALYDPAANAWTAMSKGGDPSPRTGVAWAWTGTKLLLFGGRINGTTPTSEGYVYDPTNDDWSTMAPNGAPSERYDAFAVWMGDASGKGELLVWGGRDKDGNDLNSGARYSPELDAWTPVPNAGAPSKRSAPAGRAGVSAFFGGRAILVGGLEGMAFKTDGGQYKGGGNLWDVTVPPWLSGKAHELGVGLFTGQEIIVWSGLDAGQLISGMERYQP